MTRAAISITRYCRFFRERGTSTVLDYGAGKLRNAFYLAEQGFKVIAADLPDQVDLLRTSPVALRLAGLMDTGQLSGSRLNVDLVLSTYVFNIITESNARNSYLDNIAANLRPTGYLLMEVRCRREQGACGVDCAHYFKCPKCAKTYTHEELDRLLVPRGFRRLCHYYRHQALAVVYQKDETKPGACV